MRPLILLLTALFFACAPSAAPVQPSSDSTTPGAVAPEPTPSGPPRQARIIDPSNRGWPRKVIGADGREVTIAQKPQRIHTLSLGADEITMRLVGSQRIAAITTFATDPTISNIVDASKDIKKVARDAEQILSAQPDLIVSSPFSRRDLLQQLVDTGIPVVVSDLQSAFGAYEEEIRFLAYVYGEEERGEALIREVRERVKHIDGVVATKPEAQRPRVLILSGVSAGGGVYSVSGKDTTRDGIIVRAGGINPAAEIGLDGAKQVNIETLIEMKPDILIFNDVDVASPNIRNEVVGNQVLQDLPAIKNNRIHTIPARYLDTLSHWNVRGMEELAKLLWPQDFSGVVFNDFAQE
jgi:iron complex transport system substrate-binding protein